MAKTEEAICSQTDLQVVNCVTAKISTVNSPTAQTMVYVWNQPAGLIRAGLVTTSLLFCTRKPRQWIGRNKNLSAYRDGDSLISVWQPFTGCTVKVTQTHCSDREVRCLEITTQSELKMLLTGYAVDKWVPWFSHLEGQEARLDTSRLFSELKLIQGEGETCIYPCAPNTNLLYPHASVPAVAATIPVGHSRIEVHVLAGCAQDSQ